MCIPQTHEQDIKGKISNKTITNITQSMSDDSVESIFEPHSPDTSENVEKMNNSDHQPTITDSNDKTSDKVNYNTTCEDNLDSQSYDPSKILKEIRAKNRDRLIIGSLNINSVRGKIEPLKFLVKNNLDVILISEAKLDSSFPTEQFNIDGFSTPFRLDRNALGGGLLIYVRNNIPCRQLNKHTLQPNVEGIFIELNLRKNKILLFGGYNPKKEYISHFLSSIGDNLDVYLGDYDNYLLIGDFNSEITERAMSDFCETYNLSNLIRDVTCYKNAKNPSSIDVMLTNREKRFCNSMTIESGLSDFHKLTVTVLKTYYKKQEPIKIKYRSFKNFNENNFKMDLSLKLENFNTECMTYDDFISIFMEVLDHYAPMKSKIIRGNNGPFMNRVLSKSFMKRSRLKNNYNKDPSEINKSLYKKQRNFCVNLLKREKRNYYNNLKMNIFKDNKTFWKNIKPLFSDKHKKNNKISLLINNKIITEEKVIAESLNDFFIESIEKLKIEPFTKSGPNDKTTSKSISEIIDQYNLHPSIKKIREYYDVKEVFHFHNMTSQEFKQKINNLDTKKAIAPNDIPTKVLILSNEIVSDYLTAIYNRSENVKNFPESLKLANIIPVHKKGDTNKLKNYRPVSLLPTISKLFENNMYTQILNYINKYLSPSLFGFRKGHSTEHCLLLMLELWNKALDAKKYAGAILTDLSKAFDTLNHELLIAKLSAYGFDENSLTFIYSYLRNRKQRTKIGSASSSWKYLKKGVPQGSILGPLLFNIFLNDIFLFTEKIKIANYADDNTSYSVDDDIDSLLDTLQKETNIILNWFQLNEMKANNDKCHLITTSNSSSSVTLGNKTINSASSVNLLGILIDQKITFSEHIIQLCKNGNQKLHALARVAKYLSKEKLKILMNTFIESQFRYCSLIWMFHSRTLNNKINRLHLRALRIVYKNHNGTFQDLLNLDNGFTIHERNLQKLSIEMYKIKNQLAPTLIQGLFSEHDNTYNLRNGRCWETKYIRTSTYGRETFSYMGPKTWELVPPKIKISLSLKIFKLKIKHWKPVGCTCRLCKIFIPNLGFI